jgi:formamidopyrimidine-DNA glycosylase
MPELPDLNVFSHNLTKLFAGKKIYGIEIYYPGKLNASTEIFTRSYPLKSESRWEGIEFYF